jgi:hypothetical protein
MTKVKVFKKKVKLQGQRLDGQGHGIKWLIDWLIIKGFTSRSRIFHLPYFLSYKAYADTRWLKIGAKSCGFLYLRQQDDPPTLFIKLLTI